VTVRVREGLPSLRTEALFRCVRAQIDAAKRRFLRIVHFSVQSNHVHLLVEAADRRNLARGMKGLAVRVARHLNGLLGARGSVWDDRYHARALRTPREVRNVLVYILFNHRKHGRAGGIDPCSSARYFDGWFQRATTKARASPEVVGPAPVPLVHRTALWSAAAADVPVAKGETWLLRRGWKRLGGLKLNETPRLVDR